MPQSLSYPGVYIQEVSSGVRTITGVATSVTAFVGDFSQGPTDRAVRVLSFTEFEQIYGGLDSNSEASYAVYQFFQNGGSEAWISRATGANASAASVAIASAVNGASSVLTLGAINEGAWGGDGTDKQGLRIRIDESIGSSSGKELFDLTVSLVGIVDGAERQLKTERFLNLSVDQASNRYVEKVVNDANTGSMLVRVNQVKGLSPPLANGTVSGDLSTFPSITSNTPELSVNISGADVIAKLTNKPKNLFEVRKLLEEAIQGCALQGSKPVNKACAQVTVEVVNNKLRVLAGPAAQNSPITFNKTSTDAITVGQLKLDNTNATVNLQTYKLGEGAISNTAQVAGGKAGNNGDLPGIAELRNAMLKLNDIDMFNILCLPSASIIKSSGITSLDQSSTLIQAATNYCQSRRAVFLVDPPTGLDTVDKVADWLRNQADLRNRNAITYFPRLQIPDPLDAYRLRSVGPSGTMAGLYARTDAERGVWKAPAGTEATLLNVRQLDVPINDSQNGVLNPLAINCLRSFPAYGKVCWGARTLDGSDQRASEWKYVPVRRLALFLEESLYRGTQWVVFEPNDEPLWAQIRLNIGAFLQNLFRQGAFQGSSPKEAYYVKCDRETTIQNDINLGVVNIHVGFAPLKPAEFVVIRFQQMAGQLTT